METPPYQIREYDNADKEQLLDLIAVNTPRYFAHSEMKDFEDYLQNHREQYFVIEVEERIVGSGGINFSPREKEAVLSWDIIHPDYQNQGLGKALTQRRMDEISQRSSFDSIRVRTSQLTYQFYEKMGFVLNNVQENYWAEGIDLYDMSKVLRP